MSTETTNKKIKIDNGTTFGRTYTDKAVDELLKNAGGGGISVIELTDKNGTIASAQLGKINANPQNFAFKYSGKILLFTSSDSSTYQYCNNTTSSSDNNVMTTSTLLTITSSTGAYTISNNIHNVVANSIHPANGGNLTNIQVGSKVYSIPSGGGGGISRQYDDVEISFENKEYALGEYITGGRTSRYAGVISFIVPVYHTTVGNAEFILTYNCITQGSNIAYAQLIAICTKAGLAQAEKITWSITTLIKK